MVARIDPKQNIEKELATARGALAQNRLDRGKKFLDNGQLNQAMDTLSAVALYKGTPAAAEAEKLLQVVNQDMAKAQQQAAAALDSRAKVRAADQKFQSIGALVDRAQTALQQGAGMTDNKVNMQTEYQTAIALLNRASDELQSLHNSLNTGFSNSQDKGLAPVMQEGEKMHLTIEGGLMQAYIELGYLYVSMTRVYDATRCANAAANIDPNDPRIASLRQAIEFPGGTGGVSGGPWRRWPGWGAVPAGARR
jgi:tetratricopeptide (TPR) repeat protein